MHNLEICLDEIACKSEESKPKVGSVICKRLTTMVF